MSERVTPEMIQAGQIAGYGVSTLAVERILVAALAVAPEHPAVTLLRDLQWSGPHEAWAICPQCNGWRRNGHDPDCALAKLIEVKS